MNVFEPRAASARHTRSPGSTSVRFNSRTTSKAVSAQPESPPNPSARPEQSRINYGNSQADWLPFFRSSLMPSGRRCDDFPPKSLTHSNDAELEFQSRRVYPAAKNKLCTRHKLERVTFAFGGYGSIQTALPLPPSGLQVWPGTRHGPQRTDAAISVRLTD